MATRVLESLDDQKEDEERVEEATQTEIDQQEELKEAYKKIEELEKALKMATEASARKEAPDNFVNGQENQNNKRPAEKQDSPTDIKKSKTEWKPARKYNSNSIIG